MNWQPIATAPVDTPVLVYIEDGIEPDAYYLDEGWPDDVRLFVVPAIHTKRKIADYYSEDWRWYSCVSECDHGVYDDPSHDRLSVEIAPTHWMPMPSPPTA